MRFSDRDSPALGNQRCKARELDACGLFLRACDNTDENSSRIDCSESKHVQRSIPLLLVDGISDGFSHSESEIATHATTIRDGSD